MKHKYKCLETPACRKEGCLACEGGLSICALCGLYEGSLTTDCPGVECYGSHADAVYAGHIDYRDGVWVMAASPHCPAGWCEITDIVQQTDPLVDDRWRKEFWDFVQTGDATPEFLAYLQSSADAQKACEIVLRSDHEFAGLIKLAGKGA
jgi:hypothetical protein